MQSIHATQVKVGRPAAVQTAVYRSIKRSAFKGQRLVPKQVSDSSRHLRWKLFAKDGSEGPSPQEQCYLGRGISLLKTALLLVPVICVPSIMLANAATAREPFTAEMASISSLRSLLPANVIKTVASNTLLLKAVAVAVVAVVAIQLLGTVSSWVLPAEGSKKLMLAPQAVGPTADSAAAATAQLSSPSHLAATATASAEAMSRGATAEATAQRHGSSAATARAPSTKRPAPATLRSSQGVTRKGVSVSLPMAALGSQLAYLSKFVTTTVVPQVSGIKLPTPPESPVADAIMGQLKRDVTVARMVSHQISCQLSRTASLSLPQLLGVYPPSLTCPRYSSPGPMQVGFQQRPAAVGSVSLQLRRTVSAGALAAIDAALSEDEELQQWTERARVTASSQLYRSLVEQYREGAVQAQLYHDLVSEFQQVMDAAALYRTVLAQYRESDAAETRMYHDLVEEYSQALAAAQVYQSVLAQYREADAAETAVYHGLVSEYRQIEAAKKAEQEAAAAADAEAAALYHSLVEQLQAVVPVEKVADPEAALAAQMVSSSSAASAHVMHAHGKDSDSADELHLAEWSINLLAAYSAQHAHELPEHYSLAMHRMLRWRALHTPAQQAQEESLESTNQVAVNREQQKTQQTQGTSGGFGAVREEDGAAVLRARLAALQQREAQQKPWELGFEMVGAKEAAEQAMAELAALQQQGAQREAWPLPATADARRAAEQVQARKARLLQMLQSTDVATAPVGLRPMRASAGVHMTHMPLHRRDSDSVAAEGRDWVASAGEHATSSKHEAAESVHHSKLNGSSRREVPAWDVFGLLLQQATEDHSSGSTATSSSSSRAKAGVPVGASSSSSSSDKGSSRREVPAWDIFGQLVQHVAQR